MNLTPTQTLTLVINKTIKSYSCLANGTITYEQFNNKMTIIKNVIRKVTYNVGPEYEMILDKACMVVDFAEANSKQYLKNSLQKLQDVI